MNIAMFKERNAQNPSNPLHTLILDASSVTDIDYAGVNAGSVAKVCMSLLFCKTHFRHGLSF
jgi:hypothetical protein